MKWYIDEITASIERLDLRRINIVELNGWDTFGAAETKRLIDVGKRHGITVIVGKKLAPCRKLKTTDLLVRVWAFDSNSLPGNEWWSGKANPECLTSSDDLAAASCSTIGELHNPWVNPFGKNIKVLQEREREVPASPPKPSVSSKPSQDEKSSKGIVPEAKKRPSSGSAASVQKTKRKRTTTQ